jgi:hypothetical protein
MPSILKKPEKRGPDPVGFHAALNKPFIGENQELKPKGDFITAVLKFFLEFWNAGLNITLIQWAA